MNKIIDELYDKVYNYKTKSKYGFTNDEIDYILNDYPDINMDKYYDAMMCNTCMIEGGKVINYHVDVFNAIRCGIENRDLNLSEWD